ncbi:SRPBCC family protein [Andreprevotia chitinilytica]|uniref:SRPBCC family protein n=1 Tax=Andreprevotia chitinilytica TaxID=396808 RepID=UPI0005546C8E|nr:SRPBCC family protein [Andreprevotia chitinilytica]
MWTQEASIETTATPEKIWSLFVDVPGWKQWNAGIEKIELFGAFAKGTTFSMQPPGSEPFTSTLIDVNENEAFTDETVIDDIRVVVAHCLIPLASGGTRVVYRTQIFGENAEEFGPMVAGDFPEVLAALKALAERG